MNGFTRLDSYFHSRGVACGGWLYLPEGSEKPPVVVMAHGFSGEKTFGLGWFAEKFAAAGLAVFVFDYRNFGDSGGWPRNLVSPRRHLQDWTAALKHVRKLNQVNPDRIGLWGTSFSGGHVLVTAARDGGVKAVVSQVPFVDGRASLKILAPAYILKATLASLRDWLRVITFRSPYYIPVVGPPGPVAVMNTRDAMDGYLRLVPEGSSWQNHCPARVLLETAFYRPIKSAGRIRCPVLFVPAEQDSLIPVSAVIETADRVASAEVLSRPVRHFEVYTGPEFETVVRAETEFLTKHLM